MSGSIVGKGSKFFHQQFHSFPVEDLVHLSGSFVVEDDIGVPLRSKAREHHRDWYDVDPFFGERPPDDLRRNALLNVLLNEPLAF